MRSSLTCLLASALATIASLTACNDDDAVLSTSDSICKHVPAPAGAATSLCETTIADLLHISAGLRWHDSGASDGAGDDIPMLYGEVDDMALEYARRERAPSGRTFEYASGATLLLTKALASALGATSVSDFARDALFAPLAITSAVLERDRSGTPMGSSWIFTSVRDLARVGDMLAHGGVGPNGRVLSSAWVTYLSTPGPAAFYGAHFWLVPNARGLYEGAFFADGVLDQKLVVLPKADVVIVHVGNARRTVLGLDGLVGHVAFALGLAATPPDKKIAVAIDVPRPRSGTSP